MDFLDPKRKKAHRRRLLIGYLLVAVAVAMGTAILLFSAYGYDVDRKTGDVIQNGTVFLDSQPGGSSIYLDGVLQGNNTAARLALPGSKQYTIKLTNDGYRDWSRTFSLNGGQIERIVYPLLIPKTLITTELQLYASAPLLSSQSTDRRRFLVQQPGQTYAFDFFDLANPAKAPTVISLPAASLTDPAKASTLSVVEWSSDNRHVLMDRTFDNKHEFIMFDTDTPALSVNINTVLGIAPTEVRIRDKKPDQIYLYDANGGVLRSGDLKNRTVSGPLLSNVLAFKTLGSDTILFATKTGAAEGKVNFRIRENEKATYLLKTAPVSSRYLLDIAEYDGTPYFVVGSDLDKAVFMYRNPLAALKGQSSSPLLINAVLRQDRPQFVSFSTSGQYISVQSANNITVYDILGDRQFTTELNHTIDPADKISWMDGYRFAFVSNGQSYMIDFDGSNEQQLVSAVPHGGPYFAPDFHTVFAPAPSPTVSGRFALTQTSLVKK